MSTSAAAEEHLRVIRSLMEKATVYRAISAPTALVGGCLGIIATAVFHFGNRSMNSWSDPANHLFLACWLGALFLASVANVYFLHSDAKRRGDKFVSAGMRAALGSLCPSYLVAFVLTLAFAEIPPVLPILWMLLYGLGLLGTQYFAPRSIVILGWSFLVAGLGLTSAYIWGGTITSYFERGFYLFFQNLVMGLTFGGFHLVYAACVWPRKSGAAKVGNAPSPDV